MFAYARRAVLDALRIAGRICVSIVGAGIVFVAPAIAIMSMLLPSQKPEGPRTPPITWTRFIDDPISPMAQVCGKITTPGPTHGRIECDKPFDILSEPYPRHVSGRFDGDQ
jgi:hypothetical protein